MTHYKVAILLLLLLSLILMSNSGGRGNVASAGNTGAPCEDGLVCRNCHLGGSFGLTTEEFKLIDPMSGLEVTSYQPGKLYNAEVKVNTTNGGASAYGFQATSLDTAHKDVGTWLNPSNAVQINTADIQCEGEPHSLRTYIEHVAAVPISRFRVDWQAPPCDEGEISFYFIGNAVNNNGSTSGDVGGTGSSRSYNSSIEEVITLDQPIATDTSIMASAYINLSSVISDDSDVILTASDSINILPQMEISAGSTLCIFHNTCLE